MFFELHTLAPHCFHTLLTILCCYSHFLIFSFELHTCIDNSKCSRESDAFERLISCEKLQCVEIACLAVSKHYLLSQHCYLRMADVRSLILFLLVTWLELTDCQLFYLLTYIFVFYACLFG